MTVKTAHTLSGGGGGCLTYIVVYSKYTGVHRAFLLMGLGGAGRSREGFSEVPS